MYLIAQRIQPKVLDIHISHRAEECSPQKEANERQKRTYGMQKPRQENYFDNIASHSPTHHTRPRTLEFIHVHSWTTLRRMKSHNEWKTSRYLRARFPLTLLTGAYGWQLIGRRLIQEHLTFNRAILVGRVGVENPGKHHTRQGIFLSATWTYSGFIAWDIFGKQVISVEERLPSKLFRLPIPHTHRLAGRSRATMR